MSDILGANNLPYQLVTETEAARAALAPLEAEPLIGLDTETYWDAKEKCARLSLAQVAIPSGQVWVFDVLAVGAEMLRPLVESPSVSMTAHNARFDEMVLAGAGLQPVAFVDTLTLARMTLRLASYSLASVVEHLFGVPLDKTLQRSNWRRRPLTRAQLAYAALDAHVTLRVYEELTRQLQEQGRLELALRVSTLRPRRSSTGEDGDTEERRPRRKRRVAPPAPVTPLTDEEKRIVSELKRWRLLKSNEQLLPAYMICPDKTLEHLARDRPQTLEALEAIHGLGPSKIARYGAAILEALREACRV